MTSTARGDRDKLDAIYSLRFPVQEEDNAAWRRRVWSVLVRDFFSRWIPREAAVLDFGCGIGEFINQVESRRRVGVDVRASARESLDEGVEFFLAGDANLPMLAEGEIDVIFCSNLLEHLPDRDTLLALFHEFRRVLAPDGHLLVLGPNLHYTGTAYWDFFDHILPLTHLSLTEALGAGGFETELMIPRFLPYTTVGARRTPPWMVRLYLRLPLAWRLFGAQFFAVARPRRDA